MCFFAVCGRSCQIHVRLESYLFSCSVMRALFFRGMHKYRKGWRVRRDQSWLESVLDSSAKNGRKGSAVLLAETKEWCCLIFVRASYYFSLCHRYLCPDLNTHAQNNKEIFFSLPKCCMHRFSSFGKKENKSEERAEPNWKNEVENPLECE